MTTHRLAPMPPQNLHWKILGRPVKPVAFGLTLSMLVLAWAAIVNVGVLDGSSWADVLAGACFTDAGIFAVAWWKSSQRLAELAMLLAFFIWSIRFWLILLVNTGAISTEGLWLSIGWVVIAGGSYLLEKTDAKIGRGF